MWIGWDRLEDRSIGEFEQDEFEEFCRELVRVECAERWSAGGFTLEGPAEKGNKDGGQDLIVEFRAPARVDAEAWSERWGTTALLGDPATGETLAVSCKTGKNIKAALGRDARERSERVVLALRDGGRLAVLTNALGPSSPSKPAKGKASTPKKGTKTAAAPGKGAPSAAPRTAQSEKHAMVVALAKHYAARVELLGLTEADLAARIRVIDGRDIADYARHRRPIQLAERWKGRLKLVEAGALLSAKHWEEEMNGERPGPETYREDPPRQRTIATLQQVLNLEAPPLDSATFCLIGAPGTGKTRLVHEALKRARALDRVVFCNDPQHFVEWLRDEGLLRLVPDGVFVIDDCSSQEVGEVRRAFTRAGRDLGGNAGLARLIVIRPGLDEELVREFGSQIAQLDPLEEAQAKEFVRDALGTTADDAKVGQVQRVTQGYPWFAALVAQEMARTTKIPKTSTEAAALAILPGGFENKPSLYVRARALLAIMLADDGAWSELSEDEIARLADAVDLPGGRHALDEQIGACIARGLIRGTRRRYVTPFVLEREVWRILAKHPDGPHGLYKRIRERSPGRLQRLIERLHAAGLEPRELSGIAEWVADDLRDPPSLAALSASHLTRLFPFCARHAPERTMGVLFDRIAGSSVEELREAWGLRRPFVEALMLLQAHEALFAAVEASTFRLRLAENEAYGNNASAVWAWLFVPWTASSAATFDHRLAALVRRCTEGEAAGKRSAIEGVSSLLRGLTVVGPGGAPGTERVADPQVIGRAFRAFWELLLRCATRGDGEASGAALEGVVAALSTGVHAGLLRGLESTIEEVARAAPERMRTELRRQVSVERSLASSGDGMKLPAIWRRIDEATRPRSFEERLRERLFVPDPDESDPTVIHDADVEVVREGLTEDAALLKTYLACFSAPDASRAGTLIRLAGREDSSAELRSKLADHADPYLLSMYCVGHADAGRRPLVAGWVDAWRGDARMRQALVETVARVGLDDPWLRLLQELTREGGLAGTSLVALTWGRWEGTTRDVRSELLGTLLDARHSQAPLIVAHRLAQDEEALSPQETTLLARALLSMSRTPMLGNDGWWFRRAGVRLLDAGAAHEVCAAAVQAAAHETSPGPWTWALMETCADRSPEPLWDTLARLLSDPTPPGGRLVMRLPWHDVIGRIPAERVLAWVNGDVARGRRVALMLHFGDESPPELAVALVESFGAESSVGRELSLNFASTRRLVRDLREFYQGRIATVERWMPLASPQWRTWLLHTRERLRAEILDEQDEAESERRHLGTG